MMHPEVLQAAIQEGHQATTQEVLRATAQVMKETTLAIAAAARHQDPATAAAVRHPTVEEEDTAEAAGLLREAATAEVHQEVTDDNRRQI